MKTKSYSELSKLKTFKERFDYLKLSGAVAKETFGYDRYLNQALYKSREWRNVRDKVIIRDGGCDLGVEGYSINKYPMIHHMNPITIEQINNRDPEIFNPEYLITVSKNTHNAIHYSDEEQLQTDSPVERTAGDTTLWKTVS